ncbi:MAG: class I SAM-dependent methyltransferase [Planctomycetaceae bacterium]|nr:class I SAM-dependent methyltransferase [Planctomycetaceae bacterium]
MTEAETAENWWETFHVIEMADIFLQRDSQEEIDTTVDFLIRELNLPAEANVYDQCCGTGTLSLELSRLGRNAYGADLCELYIERAREDAASNKLSSRYEVADAFQYIPPEACNGVFNWYSSFGYASDDSMNQRMLNCAFEALIPGGRFALEMLNFTGVLRNFQRCMVRRGISKGKSVTCVRESEINLSRGLLQQKWTWITEGQPEVVRNSALRMYYPWQIKEMLEIAGFIEIELYADLAKQPLCIDDSRLIVTASKPS